MDANSAIPNLLDLISQDQGLQEIGTALKDFGKGAILGNTTDALGTPVDLASMALNAVGVPVGDAPVGGSDWLRSIFSQASTDQASFAELLGSLVGAPDPQSLAALGALGIMKGQKAKTFDHDAAVALQGFEEAGLTDKSTMNQLFREFNIFRGTDKKLRQEIPDQPAKLRTSPSSEAQRMTLAEALDHPELFKAYPKLSKLPVVLAPAQASDGSAAFSLGSLLSDSFIRFNPNSNTARTDLLHEVQHAVQRMEGFARGGNVEAMKKSPEFEQVKAAAPQASDSAIARVLYRRLAGETESRNIEARAGLSPEELRLLPPWLSQDVAEENQIIKWYGKP